jgi:hypothetical protein
MWFSGLVFALFSVVVAGIQSMRLHRLSAHPDGLKIIRHSLGRKRLSDNKSLPSWLQVYAWEFSLAFLVLSVLCLIVGLTILIWAGAEFGPLKPRDDGWWDANSKVSGFSHITSQLTYIFLPDGSDIHNCPWPCDWGLGSITSRPIQGSQNYVVVAGF